MPTPIPTHRQRTKGMQRIDLAYAELASSEVVRDINRDVVLELIRTRQPISRADLSRSTGLQPSTISSIAEQLIGERWVIEGPAAIRPRGRRPTLLSINPSMVIVVADVRPDQAIVGVVDLNGRFLQRESLPLAADPERGVRNLITCIERLMPQHPDKSFEGLGIILPGRVDPSTEQLILAPNLPWARYDIKAAIQSAINLQVEMDNDANACLLAELWFGRMEGVRNAVLVTITEGVGAAILANGQLLTGRSGLAGEFGHLCLDPNGPVCGCGRKGCWEVFASTRAAIHHFQHLREQDGKPAIPPPSSLELMNLAENGDPDAIAALHRQAYYMGHGLRIIVTALSPEVVLINGGLTSSWDRFGPIVEAELADSMLSGTPPRIIVTSDVELARLRGAAALVLQRHAGYSRSNASDGKPVRRPRTKKKATA